MEFLETHWVEFVIGAMFLWACVSLFKINNTKDKAEMAVAVIAGKEDWSTFQELTIGRQTNIDSTLKNIEIALACIFSLLVVLAFKLII